MTGANRFTFDIIANDKASDATSKAKSNVDALTTSLNTASEAYERMAGAQRRVGVGNGGAQVAVMRQISREQQNQERTAQRLEQQRARRAAQENADAQRRASLVASSAAREEAAYRAIQTAIDRSTAAQARGAALSQGASQARIAALNNEIQRTQALVQLKAQEVAAAQRVAEVARRSVSTSRGSLGTGAGDSRSAAAAAVALQNATRGLTAAQQANATAAAALAAEQRKLDLANTRLAQSNQTNEAQLNTTRYALYQVAAAYTALGRATLGAGTDIAKTAIDFEAAFAQVTRTTGLGEEVRQGVAGAAESVDILRNQFVALSTQIPKSFQDLTQIGALGAQLGIAKADILDFTEVVAKFSATTNVSTEQAAQEFGRLGNLLDVPASKFENLASSVSYLGTTSVATESEILAVAAQVGAVGTNAGLSAPYVVGLSTALASLRVAPELARGATTRIFSNITRSVAEGGEKLDAFAKVLGITSDKAAALFENNPEKFFSDLVTGLGTASDNGQNLTLILDSLGIKASRDVQVITRLANSYQLLGDYTGKAFESFTKGTYLDTSFQDIAETTQAALTNMANSFSAFKDSVGSAFLKPIEIAANALNAFFQVLTAIPASISGPFAGVLVAVGILAAFRAASALAGAAVLAFRAAGQSLGGTSLSLLSVLKLLNATQAQVAGTAGAAAGALRAQTVAMGGVTAAGASAAAATGAVAATSTAAAGAVGVLAGGFRVLMAALGPVGWALLAVGAVAGLIGGLASDSNNAAEEAERLRQEQDALNQSWQQAGNGADALQKAIREDTKAYQEAQAAGKDVSGAFKVITQDSDVASNGFAGYTKAMADATDQTAPTVAGVDAVSTAVQNNTVALGESTREWEKAALFDKLSTLFAGNDMQKALKQLEAIQPGILKDAIAASLEGGPEAVAASFGKTTDMLQSEMARLNKILDTEYLKPDQVFDPKLVEETTAKLKDMQAQWSLLAQLQQQFRDADTALEQAAATQQLQSALSGALGIISDDFGETGDAAKDAADAIRDTQDAYAGLVDDIFATSNLESALLDAFEGLGESLADNGTDFSNFTDAGRANIAALQDAVVAFAATQDDAIKNQGLSAEQAAANTAQFIQDTMAELSNQGVDTSQLDFLNNYLAQLTGTNYQVRVNGDVSGAVSQLNFLQSYLNSITNSFNNVLGAVARVAGTAPKTVNLKAPSKVAAPRPRAAVSTPRLAQSLGGGRSAQEAKNLEKANKAAGGAAKKAGDAQKKAADEASEALKKQKEYVKDLAGFYENLASKAFGAIKAEGDSFKSLQELGQSLTENGKSFNTFTERGRQNMSALTDVFDSFGKTLSLQIEQGTLSADGAAAKYRDFARGVYGELVSLGVPTEQLTGFFRALGVSATGWTGNSGDVQQYAGFISAAANVTGKLAKELDAAKEYADALGSALTKSFDQFYGLGSAIDDVQSAMNDMRDAYQDNIDKVQELRRENNGLSADLSGVQSDKRKAEIERDISTKYGETDRAAKYQGDADTAGASIADIQAKIAANQKEAKTLEEGRNALTGFSDAAIENRATLRSLQSQMLKQIEAYAATGASTQQVSDYTDQMRREFIDVALQAGYTRNDIVEYTGAFERYIAVIRTVPSNINTVATADTSQAMSALNAIPRSITSMTYATLDGNSYRYVTDYLNAIPKRGDYTITPKVDGGAAGAAGSGAGGILGNAMGDAINNTVNAKLASTYQSIRNSAAQIGAIIGNIWGSIPTGGGGGGTPMRATVWTGGQIKFGGVRQGFASGGYVPGRPPKDPRVDNLLAQGPGGLFGIRSGEYVVQEPTVKKFGLPFFDALNNGELPGFYQGGFSGGSSGGGGRMIVELSPDDRALLGRGNRGGGTTLLLDGMVLAKSTDKRNGQLARNGSN